MPSLQNFIIESVTQLSLDPIVLDEPVSIEQLPTPALTIDLDVFDANLLKMQNHLKDNGMDLRCHTKMHKSPIIAKQQIANGALGICCATVSEAEVMLASGINNILITSPVVTSDKIARFIVLAAQSSELAIVVDDLEVANRFERAAAEAKLVINIYIDLDPGMGRTGITPGEPALALGKHILANCPHLKFCGLQMYIGNCMHIVDYQKRKEKYARLLSKGQETRQLFEAEGIAVPVFSGGGTGTYDIDSEIGTLTELQAGSYVFMDVEYRDIASREGPRFLDFEASLFVLVTAISQPQSTMITVDAGIKSLASDTAYPEFRDIEGTRYHLGGDEHGIVQLNNPSRVINLGDKLSVMTPHCDPTVNLYDFYYPYRDGLVKEIWPISARGKSQ